ncbi:MAG: Holliday junction branch migration protein RuvA [Armatimonadota bacterium]
MIHQLKGIISGISKNLVIIDVNGVGYGVNVPLRTIGKLNLDDEVKLSAHTCVKEDDISIYGFETNIDKELFLMMISVSGIGPKAALSILNNYDAVKLAKIIFKQDVASLTKVPGVGKKTAQRLVVELAEKVGLIIPKDYPAEKESFTEEAKEVLMSLGLSSKESEDIIDKAASQFEKTAHFDEFIEKCLVIMGK